MCDEASFVPYQAKSCFPARSVLVLAPHADDEVFGCGGAIARHSDAGIPVSIVIVSDGAFQVTTELHAAYCRKRENESIAAASILGCPPPTFWRLPDRGLIPDATLIDRITTSIHTTAADLIYAPALSEAHPDHRALAQATVLAIDQLTYPNGGGGNQNIAVQIAMYEIGMPLHANRLLDITPVWSRKEAAMACFVSQLAQQRYDQQVTGLNRYRSYTLGAHVSHAEAYALYTREELASCAASIRSHGGATLPPWVPPDPVLHSRLTACERECRRLENELSQLHSSHSWKITAPLREIRQWIGKRK